MIENNPFQIISLPPYPTKADMVLDSTELHEGQPVETVGTNTVDDGNGKSYIKHTRNRPATETASSVFGIGVDDWFELTTSSSSVGSISGLAVLTYDTVAAAIAASLSDGDRVKTAGYTTAGDGGGNEYIYHSTGRPTADGGFYINGSGADDYFEAVDRSVARAKQFGAFGTAAAQTAALQAAIDSTETNIVDLQGGSYSLDANGLGVATDNKTINGNGATLTGTAQSTRTVFGFSNTLMTVKAADGVKLNNFTLDNASQDSNGLGFHDAHSLECDSVTVTNAGKSGGFVVAGCNDFVFHKCVAKDSAAATASRGLWIGNGNAGANCQRGIITDCNFSNNLASGLVLSGDELTARGNICNDNAGAGIVVANGDPSSVRNNITVVGNVCMRNAFHGIQSGDGSTTNTVGANIIGNTCGANTNAGIYVTKNDKSQVVGNTCKDNVSAGITVAVGVTTTSISSNTCIGGVYGISATPSGATTVSGITADGNQLVDCTNGIFMSASSGGTLEDVLVSNNVTKDCTTGIRINANSGAFLTEATIKGNSTIGGTTAYNLGGAGTLSEIQITDNRNNGGSIVESGLAAQERHGNDWDPGSFSGSGTPEGVVTAAIGSTYVRTDGGAGTTLYVKESGAGNTGWVAVHAGKEVAEETLTAAAPALSVFGASLLDSSINAIAATLGGGEYIGQRKAIVMTDATNSSTVSVTNHETSDPEVFTFNAVDEYLSLEWSGTEWATIKATATV